MEEILANQILDEGLTSRLYKEVLQINRQIFFKKE